MQDTMGREGCVGVEVMRGEIQHRREKCRGTVSLAGPHACARQVPAFVADKFGPRPAAGYRQGVGGRGGRATRYQAPEQQL